MNVLQDKIRGCFLGIAIGDALGKPVETYTPQEIASNFGRITNYQSNSKHKYFSESLKGTTTDDWQLTKAVARAFINKGEFDLNEISKQHCDEYLISVAGWGNSTRESIGSIVSGTSWLDSGKNDKNNRGVGNGVCMKVSPIGIYRVKAVESLNDINVMQLAEIEFDKKVIQLSEMTHFTKLGCESGLAQVAAISYCLKRVLFYDGDFPEIDFLNSVISQVEKLNYRSDESISLNDKFKEMRECLRDNGKISDNQIFEMFGKGSCYVYESLPFSYAWFLKNPNSIESLFDCVNAGGDTDTNASMVGALLGVLNGTKVFPDYLIEGLVEKDEVLEVADKFYEIMRT